MGLHAFSAALRRKLAPLRAGKPPPDNPKHNPKSRRSLDSPFLRSRKSVDSPHAHTRSSLDSHPRAASPNAASPSVAKPTDTNPAVADTSVVNNRVTVTVEVPSDAPVDIAPPKPVEKPAEKPTDRPRAIKRKAQKAPAKPPVRTASRTSNLYNFRPSQRRSRSKDASASDIITTLSNLDAVPPANFTSNLANRLCADTNLLSDFLRPLVDPTVRDLSANLMTAPASSHSCVQLSLNGTGDSADPATSAQLAEGNDVRSHLRVAWIVATFLRYGPPQLRDTIANHPPHVKRLVSIFDTVPIMLDVPRAELVADLLRTLLHAHPREMATVLVEKDVLSSLLRHAAQPPVADLLPRLVASRPFPSGLIVAAHKRAVVGLSKSDALARLSASVLTAVSEGEASRVAVLVSGLCEIGTRAAEVPRKMEEPDERNDAMFATSVGVITSAAFNDALDELDLTKRPAPLLSVVDAALAEAPGDDTFLSPALRALERVLRAASGAKNASALCDALPKFVAPLAEILDKTDATKAAPGRVGTLRVVVLDVVSAAAECLPPTGLSSLLGKDKCALLRSVLDVSARWPENDVVSTAVGRILTGVFERGDAALVGDAARHAGAVRAAHARLAQRPLAECVGAAARWAEEERLSSLDVGDLTRSRLGEMAAAVQTYTDEEAADSFGSAARAGMQKSGGVGGGEMMSSSDPGASEDFGHELFVMGAVHEASRGHNEAPPSDGVVDSVVDSVATFLWHAHHRKK